jgi:hypothetical protein
VSTWLAPVDLTVEGRAASEQTWIMGILCLPHYRAALPAGEGLDRNAVIARSVGDETIQRLSPFRHGRA